MDVRTVVGTDVRKSTVVRADVRTDARTDVGTDVHTDVLIVLSCDKTASPDLIVIGYHEILK